MPAVAKIPSAAGYNDNMLVGVWKDSLIVRLGPDDYDDALLEPHVREFDITDLSGALPCRSSFSAGITISLPGYGSLCCCAPRTAEGNGRRPGHDARQADFSTIMDKISCSRLGFTGLTMKWSIPASWAFILSDSRP
jgi:hypothetical protein